MPESGYLDPEIFWLEYSSFTKIKLDPGVVTAGREAASKELFEFLSRTPPGIRGVRSANKNESIAFIVGSAMQSEINSSNLFFSKTLIIERLDLYRHIWRTAEGKLNLIAHFDELDKVHAAVDQGHHVLVPLGSDDEWGEQCINLPIIDADGQIDGLVKSGIDRDRAAQISFESGRDVTIIKKRLGFPPTKMAWLENKDLREMVPALMLGRWDKAKTGDRELIEKLCGTKYEDYSLLMDNWSGISDAPVLKIGSVWRVKSPIEIWIQLASKLSTKDFDSLKEVFLALFTNVKPQEASLWNSHQGIYSEAVKMGVVQNLTLISYYGDSLQIKSLNTKHQVWVDGLIKDFLTAPNVSIWSSSTDILARIAEASPLAFLDALEYLLDNDLQYIISLFNEHDSFFSTQSSHTGLLWALEGLAWFPEYLSRSATALAKLAEVDPGGKLINRPINSLIEIFKPRHYQTAAPLGTAKKVLTLLAKKSPDTAWQLLLSMIKEGYDTAFTTYRFKWRSLGLMANEVTYSEFFDMQSFALGLMLAIFRGTHKQITDLLGESGTKNLEKRVKILQAIQSGITTLGNEEKIEIRNTLRKTLHRHRAFPAAKWALSEAELKPFDDLYNVLVPEDVIGKNEWLFSEFSPDLPLPAPYEKKDGADDFSEGHRKNESLIEALRTEALINISEAVGMDQMLAWALKMPTGLAIGFLLADIVSDDKEELKILRLIAEHSPVVTGYIAKKNTPESFEWMLSKYEVLAEEGFTADLLSWLFFWVKPSVNTWDRIKALSDEVYNSYWEQTNISLSGTDKETLQAGILNFLEHGRAAIVLQECYSNINRLDLEIIYKVLAGYIKLAAKARANMESYYVQHLMEHLQNNVTVELLSRLTELEWAFLPIIDDYGKKSFPVFLEREMANNPTFFIKVLNTAFLPKTRKLEQEENDDPNTAKLSLNAYRLISKWKTIPGLDSKNNIDADILNSWVDTSRTLAVEADRLDIADAMIGQVFAQYPNEPIEGKGIYPAREICDVIERINSPSINNNFSAALSNKRGFSSRALFEGGNIERAHAQFFANLAEETLIEYPVISKIYSGLSAGYLENAKREDAEAQNMRLDF